MNKRLLLIPFASMVLASCGASNAFSGKSYKPKSGTATYEGTYTETTFFEGFSSLFTGLKDFVNKAADYYCSTNKGELTKNKALNFTSELGASATAYKGKHVNAFVVNYERVSENESTERCHYFVDNDVARFVKYESGEYVDYPVSGLNVSDNTQYSYTYVDTGMKQEGEDMNMALTLTLTSQTIGKPESKTSRTANVVIAWAKA